MIVACSNIDKPNTLPRIAAEGSSGIAPWSELKVVDILRFLPTQPELPI